MTVEQIANEKVQFKQKQQHYRTNNTHGVEFGNRSLKPDEMRFTLYLPYVLFSFILLADCVGLSTLR